MQFTFAHNNFNVADLDASLAFYEKALGLREVRVRAMERYLDEWGAVGFFLCMTLRGMVRVIQAAGRLIRTESDRGALLLIDSRYQRRAERELLSGTLIGEALSG